jgi:filamentous hemagglutinin
MKLMIDRGKFAYLFGEVTSGSHNTARSMQLALQMKRLGISNNSTGRALLTESLENIVQKSDNILNTFIKGVQNFEVRQALFAGPAGKFGLFEATFEVMPDNTRRFVTLIIKGVE